MRMKNPDLTRWELAEVIAARIRERPGVGDVTVRASAEDGDPEIAFTQQADPADPVRQPYHAIASTDSHWTDFRRGVPLEEILGRVVASLGDMRGNEYDWPQARPALRIQLQPVADVCAAEAIAQGTTDRETTGGKAVLLVWREWAFGIAARLCIDRPHSILSVSTGHLAAWGVTPAEAWRVAIANARRDALAHSAHKGRPADGLTFRLYDAPSGYSATRALWPELFGPLAPTRRRLLSAPQRDQLLAADISYRHGPAQIVAGVEALARFHRAASTHAYRAFPRGLILIDDPDTRRWKQLYPQLDDTILAPPAEALIPEEPGTP